MKTPQDVLEQWMQAVNNGDVESLLGLYDSLNTYQFLS